METTNANRSFGLLFWIVAVIALIWNGLGSMNLVQQMNPSGLSTLPPEYQAYLKVRPTWALGAFAVSVIAGLIGALLMFFRSRKSVPAFVLSGIGAFVATVSAVSSGIPSVIIGSALSVIVAAAFAAYSWRNLG